MMDRCSSHPFLIVSATRKQGKKMSTVIPCKHKGQTFCRVKEGSVRCRSTAWRRLKAVCSQLHNATTLVEETAESEQLSTDFPGGKLARCMQETISGLPQI